MRCRLTAPSPFAAFRKARPLASALFGLVTHLAAFYATNNPDVLASRTSPPPNVA
jgi:hypothetical protein